MIENENAKFESTLQISQKGPTNEPKRKPFQTQFIKLVVKYELSGFEKEKPRIIKNKKKGTEKLYERSRLSSCL